jgi:glycosyltransferase involved in cell wall biosynthesis
LLRRLATDLARLPFDTRTILDRLAPLMPRVPRLTQTLDGLPPGFDLVHGINISLEWPLIAGWRFARARGLPFVATPFVHVGQRTVQRFYTMPHQLAVLRDADRVFVQTGIEEEELVRLGVPGQHIVRLGMGVDLDEVRGGDRDRFRARHGVRGPVVTFMGAITDDKGAVHLLRAMQQLWQGGSDATLVIAGQPIVPSTFEGVFDKLPADHQVRTRRLGPVSGQPKQDMLAATDVFALPSQVDSFGIVYLEAWSYGLPVIGCQAGGVPDVIADGQDGLLVDFGDVGGLAAAIERLLADTDHRQAMGRRGRAKVERRYTWDHTYRILSTTYQEIACASHREAGLAA